MRAIPRRSIPGPDPVKGEFRFPGYGSVEVPGGTSTGSIYRRPSSRSRETDGGTPRP